MENQSSGRFDLEYLSRGGYLCGISTVVVSSGSLTGSSTFGGITPLIALAGAFLAAGVWMFQRWGVSPERHSQPEPSPGMAASAHQGDEPAKA